jgi:phospholipase/carboxylesterase/glyoxalase family protein
MNDRQSLKEPGFIHRFIPAAAEGAPTLLLLHGTGGDEDDLIELGRLVAPGAALLSPRGKVLENGMPRFFRRLAEGVFDLEDVRFRTVELAEFVDTAARAYGVEPSRMVAAGYSNGANIAASLLLLKPGALAAAVLFHAMVPIVPDPLPDLKGVPVFITGGKQDTMIAPRETERLARLLESAGASVQLAWQPGGHGLSNPEIEAAREWFRGIEINEGRKNDRD